MQDIQTQPSRYLNPHFSAASFKPRLKLAVRNELEPKIETRSKVRRWRVRHRFSAYFAQILFRELSPSIQAEITVTTKSSDEGELAGTRVFL